MLHPDYQYTPKLVTAMASMIASEEFDVVLASRILGRGALVGGMPMYKYVSNRVLTLFENIMIGQKLSEYHTGYRAWSRAVLEKLPLGGFRFRQPDARSIRLFLVLDRRDQLPDQILPEASSINFRRSVVYGLGVLKISVQYRLQHMGLIASPLFADTAESRLPVVADSDFNRLPVGSEPSA